jgi:preprotein translocase subunit Sec63
MKKDFTLKAGAKNIMEARKAACRIIGVGENVNKADLKKAYRRAAIQYHPDRSGNTQEANRKFLILKCAYELLAFDKPCDNLLEEINSWSGVPDDSKYRLDNPWGHFLWWREKFFSTEDNKKEHKNISCI